MNNKITLTIAFIITLFLIGVSQNHAQKTNSLKTIIIDPGHGKPDIGARGSFSVESDVTLAFGLKLSEAIKKHFPDIHVVMTRNDDKLPNQLSNSGDANRLRANIANEQKGDLFIAIHADSEAQKYKKKLIGTKDKLVTIKEKGGKKVKKMIKQNIYQKIPLPHKTVGSSLYIIAAHKSKDKNEIIRENMDMLIEDTSSQLEFNSPELMAMASIWQKKFFKKSFLFASLIHEEFKRKNRVSLGVKQRNKGIWVLQATSMPSVLVETGYICTESEEIYLNSEEGQNQIIDAIIIALRNYKNLIDANVYNVPKELIAPEVTTNETNLFGDIPPTERVEKLYKTLSFKSENIKIGLINNLEDDSSTYSVAENAIFIDNKKITSNKAEEFILKFDKGEEIDLTIFANKLKEPTSVGSLNIILEADGKQHIVPVFISDTENASIILKRK